MNQQISAFANRDEELINHDVDRFPRPSVLPSPRALASLLEFYLNIDLTPIPTLNMDNCAASKQNRRFERCLLINCLYSRPEEGRMINTHLAFRKKQTALPSLEWHKVVQGFLE